MNLLQRAQIAEETKNKILKLYSELIPKHRSLKEIADIVGVSKSRVHQIIYGKKNKKNNYAARRKTSIV